MATGSYWATKEKKITEYTNITMGEEEKLVRALSMPMEKWFLNLTAEE